MAYLDTINKFSTNYALNAFSNLLICSDTITSAKTVTFPDGYNFTDGNNMTFRVLFKNGHNCANASTPMTLNEIVVVVNKYGSLIPLPIHNINSTYKSLQANTVLEMYYIPNYDGNDTPAFVVVGNPVVLSDTDYTIYADGQMGGCPPINSVYVQYPQCKSPNVIWFLTTWTEIDYNGHFFRASGGNADPYIDEGSVLNEQAQGTAVNGININTTELKGHATQTTGKSNGPFTARSGIISGLRESVGYSVGGDGSWSGTYYKGFNIDATHTHSINGDTETRPINYTIRVWKRVS